MKPLLDAALLADSGPATPSMAPLPNSSGYFENLFSAAYETKEEMTAPPPGRMPSRKPISVPLPMGLADFRQSSVVGKSCLKVSSSLHASCRFPPG